ncbi:MAG: lytic transglycosylase domain-containing protein [Acidobacteria bacterium]|nr:lytic transglycosylase domain-containing protein [Acidobacteriota bacterium]
MISLALQGSCRSAKDVAGTSVAIADDMKKRNIRSITFLSVLVFVFPLTVASQETQTISRTSLARMDVLSRARLFEPTIEKAARNEGVDPLILWTIAYNETRFRPWLTSPKNAQGLMQFMPATAARFGLADPYEPTSSLLAAAKYVKYLGRLFDWKLESVLAAFNAGEGTVSAYLHGRELRVNGRVINASRRRMVGGVPPYRETLGYVTQGVEVYRWLQRQGRMSVPTNTFRPEQNANKEEPTKIVEVKESQAISVFYDPRTGKRSVMSSSNLNRLPQLDFGPVIVDPALPTNSNQLARSTFAGKLKNSEPSK